MWERRRRGARPRSKDSLSFQLSPLVTVVLTPIGTFSDGCLDPHRHGDDGVYLYEVVKLSTWNILFDHDYAVIWY